MRIEAGPERAEYPNLTVDAAGNVIAIWKQADQIWSNRYVTGVGWSVSQAIGNALGALGRISDFRPIIYFDGAGDALAVWLNQGANEEIWFNVYQNGVGWVVAQALVTDGVGISTL